MTNIPLLRLFVFALEEEIRASCMAEYTEQTKKLIELIRGLREGATYTL